MENGKELLKDRLSKLIYDRYENLLAFHRAIIEKAGKDDAISYGSLRYATKSTAKPHDKTIQQIAAVLKMPVYDLIKGTTAEPPIDGPAASYKQLNDSSTLWNLWNRLPIKQEVMKIEGRGESIDEQNVFYDTKAYRFVYVIHGTVELVLKYKDHLETKELKEGDFHCFDAGVVHIFKNNKSHYAKILITNFKKGTPYEE